MNLLKGLVMEMYLCTAVELISDDVDVEFASSGDMVEGGVVLSAISLSSLNTITVCKWITRSFVLNRTSACGKVLQWRHFLWQGMRTFSDTDSLSV